ncbi:hypothetical protein [Bacillus cereus]|uniref:hypothetical protein n=1 Tax=Bacillus cereus TaxID=1396 RepID=UPI0024BD3D36|nr:hypothetical protein [Bacillus cereus]
MLAKEMIETIKQVESQQHGITKLYKSRISYFQNQNPKTTIGVEFDNEFDKFITEIEMVMQCTVQLPTAKKILNNWYIWAKEQRESLQRIKPFDYDSDPVEFLIKNEFHIEHSKFAQIAEKDTIEIFKKRIPKNSSLHIKLKSVADSAYPSPKGFTYEYLIKTLAGFSSMWK